MILFMFGKKKSMTPDDVKAQLEKEAEEQASANQKTDTQVNTGNPKIDIELTKIFAQLEGSAEIRKANSERFSRLGEQIGELRGMIMDTNKAMSKTEVSATKAIDLVESVQPEKLMIEVRKQDGKLEALRASIESNESLMKDLMVEMKKMRDQMSFYKGVEQVMKLNEETKTELAENKRVAALMARHADKVETIFVEVGKKFSEFERFNDLAKSLDSGFKRIESDFDKMKVQIDVKANKKDFSKMVDKFNEFEKHTGNILKLLDAKTKQTKKDLDSKFDQIRDQLEKRTKMKFSLEETASEQTAKKGGVFSKFSKSKGSIEGAAGPITKGSLESDGAGGDAAEKAA